MLREENWKQEQTSFLYSWWQKCDDYLSLFLFIFQKSNPWRIHKVYEQLPRCVLTIYKYKNPCCSWIDYSFCSTLLTAYLPPGRANFILICYNFDWIENIQLIKHPSAVTANAKIRCCCKRPLWGVWCSDLWDFNFKDVRHHCFTTKPRNKHTQTRSHFYKKYGENTQIPSFPILYCVKLKKPPGAKSWEPGYFETCLQRKSNVIIIAAFLFIP